MSRLTQLRTFYRNHRQHPAPPVDLVAQAIQEYRVFLTWGLLPSRFLAISPLTLTDHMLGMDRRMAFEANNQRQAMIFRDQFVFCAQAWQRNTGFDPLEYLRELNAAQAAQTTNATTETTAIAAEPVAVVAVAAPFIPVATRVSTCAASCVSTCAASWTTTFPDNWSES